MIDRNSKMPEKLFILKAITREFVCFDLMCRQNGGVLACINKNLRQMMKTLNKLPSLLNKKREFCGKTIGFVQICIFCSKNPECLCSNQTFLFHDQRIVT